MTFADLVNQFISLANLTFPILIGVAVLIFIVKIIQYMGKSDSSDGQKNLRIVIIWGIIGLTVLLSFMGIVRLLVSDLLL